MSITIFYTEMGGPRLHSSEPDGLSERCTLAYLNEGGANFIFRILPNRSDVELPQHLSGKLLRLQKDLPSAAPVRDQLAALKEHFQPLFQPDHVIRYELIELDAGLPDLINARVKELHRHSHRHEHFLPSNELHGLLVTDMTPSGDQLLLQLKPKWLAQSRSAPKRARRCRTCALRARRASHRICTPTDAQASCPLGLVSEQIEERRRTAYTITDDDQLQEYLVNDAQPLFNLLRSWQLKLDAHGILNTNAKDSYVQDLCKAMTLRDCTLFLRRSGDQIEARFADLDLKQAEKLAVWKKVENELNIGGWYTNTEHEADWSEETVCVLAR